MYRNRRLFAFVLIIVVIGLLTAFFGQTVMAQSVTPTVQAGEVEIVGMVTDFSGLTITILGQVIDISRAEFYGPFAIGEVVRVKAVTNPDGTLAAIEVEPARAGADDNSNDNTAGNTNDNTGDNSNDNSSDNANSNDNVGNDNSDDNGNDNSVDFEQEFELSGTVTEIGADFVVVSGFRLGTAGTRIEGAVTVGAVVKAEVRLVNNAYVASRIELTSSGDDRVLPADCVVRAPAGWTTYAVQFGDTLSGIAVGSGARLADIVTVNCIANPNSVAVGTVLFVPREPQPLTGSDNSNDNSGDNGNDNSDDNGNDDDRGNDNGNDNSDDKSNDNGDDHGGDNSNDNGDDSGSNDNGDDHGGDNGDDD